MYQQSASDVLVELLTKQLVDPGTSSFVRPWVLDVFSNINLIKENFPFRTPTPRMG